MMKNSKIISEMIKSVKKNKMINFKVNKKINKIIDKGVLNSVKMKDNNISNYNLIIICTGYNSQLVRDYFKDKPLHHSYDETSVTTVLEHESTQNNTARQIFLNDEILALLPISNTKTSVVLSMKKKLLKKYMYEKKNFFLKKKIMFYTKDFFKKKKIVNNIEKRDINLLIRKKYIQNRILLFGDALHVVHPLAGQGFNMVLRDLTFLVKIFKNKIELGLDVGSSDILSEFSNKIKPQNFAYSLGIDFIKNIFSIKRSTLKDMRNKIIVRLNRSSFAKDVFFNLANKGFKF
jgi:2-octaprenyl-6-methoxyphenol hydroxylase